jgi:hypothetical protein
MLESPCVTVVLLYLVAIEKAVFSGSEPEGEGAKDKPE